MMTAEAGRSKLWRPLNRGGTEQPLAKSSILLHTAFVCAVMLLAGAVEDASLFLIVCGSLASIMYPLLAYAEMRRERLLLNPISFYFLWYSVGLGPSAIFIGFLMQVRPYLGFGAAILTPEDLIPGYVLFVVGSFALHMGMEAFRPREKLAQWQFVRPASLVGLFSCIGFSLLLDLTNTKSYLGTLVQPFSFAPHALLLLVALGTYRDWRWGRLPYMAVLAAGTAALLLVAWRTGAKSVVMYSFLPVAWGMIYHKSRRWMIIPTALALSVVYLTVVAPVIMTFRAQGSPTDQRTLSVRDGIDIFADSGQQDNSGVTGIPASLEQLFERQFESSATAFLYRQVGLTGLMKGETFQDLAVAVIPRFLYPDKPTLSRGTWFYAYTGKTANVAASNLGMTSAGEWYWNFGWAGVLTGMFATGALLSWLVWRPLRTHPTQDGILTMFYVAVVFQVNQLSDATNPCLGIVATGIVLRSMIAIMDVRQRRFKVRIPLRSALP